MPLLPVALQIAGFVPEVYNPLLTSDVKLKSVTSIGPEAGSGFCYPLSIRILDVLSQGHAALLAVDRPKFTSDPVRRSG